MNIYIKTYGCQMNERDSEAVGAMLQTHGHTLVDSEENADVLIFNTCSVRDQAERKAIGKVGILKRLKRKNPDIFIGIMGCMAQSRGEELLEEIPHLDFVVGTDQLHTLPTIIEKESTRRHKRAAVGHGDDVLVNLSSHLDRKDKTSDFVAITRGCNRFCSYCIVPHVRGREKSREVADILEESRLLVSKGVLEITLLGQNVAAFGLNGITTPPAPDHSPFADLLVEMGKIEGLQRIRFTSPYPTYFNDKLIQTIIEQPKVCKNIHLPLQSGSDRILKLMNRQYTAEQYLEVVRRIREAIPTVTFSTDIILGFPGETDEDFQKTREMFQAVKYDNAYIFKYSPRRDTPAATMDNQVPQEVKEERQQILLADLKEITIANNQALVGQRLPVLVSGLSKRNKSRWSGRLDNNSVVVFENDGSVNVGDIVDLKIVKSSSSTLYGEL